MANALDLTLHALHDPTRRYVLELLKGGERSVRELTDDAQVSQSAVSQHLKVLREAELVAVRPVGTRRLYRIDTRGLAEVRAWVDSFWDDALHAFVRHADEAVAEVTTDDTTDPRTSTRDDVAPDARLVSGADRKDRP